MVRPTAVKLEGFRGVGWQMCRQRKFVGAGAEKFDPRRLKPQNCYGGHSGRGGKSGEAAQKGRDLRLLASVALKLG
jgi:hypothetical protein